MGALAMIAHLDRSGLRAFDALEIVEFLIALGQPEPGDTRWAAPIQAIHSALANLKPSFPELLASVRFSPNTVEPYSRAVDESISSLGAAGLVSVENPDFRWLSVKPGVREAFCEALDELTPPEMQVVQELARRFNAEICTARRANA